MKRNTFKTLSITLLLGMMLVSLPVSALAFDFQWNTGTQVSIDPEKVAPPASWLQLVSEGVKTTGATTICHPFRQGLNNWIANVYELKDGKWTKLTTTMGWIPSEEGNYMACAKAPEAGTYALYAYYHVAVETVVEATPDYSGSWNTGVEVSVDMEKYPGPDWVHVWSQAVRVTAKKQICHEFQQAQYGWKPIILQLVNGEWQKLSGATTLVEGEENNFTACAYATLPGTYALFGYMK